MPLTKKEKLDDIQQLERYAIKDTTKANRVVITKRGSTDIESIFMATKRIEDGKKKKRSLEF